MAEPVTYDCEINPSVAVRPSVKKDGGYSNSILLSVVNRNAVVDFLDLIAAGTDVSSVVTAIDAL